MSMYGYLIINLYFCIKISTKMDIKTRLKKIISWRLLAGILIGGIAGYAYYYFVGCNSGTCAITSNPYKSAIFGMIAGGLIAS